jgi:hypothetical protein
MLEEKGDIILIKIRLTFDDGSQSLISVIDRHSHMMS